MSLKIVVLASGRGSNFEAIVKAINAKKCDAKILALISDNPLAPALKIAKENSITAVTVDAKKFSDKLLFDKKLLSEISSFSPDIIVLAGYMRILRSPKIFEKYGGKIINIHPSLLPKYPGAHAQADAFSAGEKISGLTIHLVDKSLDGGPIIYQEKVDISKCKSSDEVSETILKREHIALPELINKISKGEIKLK